MSVTSSKLENCEKIVYAEHKSQREQTKNSKSVNTK